jgi:hypothetical protein
MPDLQPFSIQIPHPLSPPPHPLQSRAAPSHSPPPHRPATTRPSPHRTARYVARPGSFSFTFTGSIPPPVLTPAQELSITPAIRTIIVFNTLMVFVFGFVVSTQPGFGMTSPPQGPPSLRDPPPKCASKMSSRLQRNQSKHAPAPFLNAFQSPQSTPLDSHLHGTPHASLTP